MGVLDDSRYPVPTRSWLRDMTTYAAPPDLVVPAQAWTLVDVPLQRQQKTRWCWAAVAVCVDAAYGRTPPLDQCRVASSVLGESCCVGGCNRDFTLPPALTQVGRYARKELGALDVDELRSELVNSRPVAVLVKWRGGGGHFVIITGVIDSEPSPRVEVADTDGQIVRRMELERLRTSYRDLGEWRMTYYTRP